MSNVIITSPDKNITGVKPKVADKIYELLKKGKRNFGSSGAALTHYAFSPEYENMEGLDREAAKDAVEGERETTKFLRDWAKKYPNVVILDSLRIPDWKPPEFNPEVGYPEDIALSHAIVMGSEIILVDTKRWAKKKTFSVTDDGDVIQGRNSFPGGNVRIPETIDGWLDYLDEGASLATFVCVNNEETSVIRDRNWFTQEYRLVEIDRMEETLDKWVEKVDSYDKERIETTLVSQLAVRAVKPYDIYSRVFNMENLNKFR